MCCYGDRVTNGEAKCQIMALLCEMCIRELPDPDRCEVQNSLVTNTEFSLQKTPSTRPTMQEIIDDEKKFNFPSYNHTLNSM